VSQGKTIPQACKEVGIVEQTFYRWRKEYGGLQVEQAKKLKDLQRENAQLRRAVADLTVENSEVRVVRAHRAVQLTGGLSCLYGCDKRGNGGALRIVGLASGNIGACAMGCGAKA